MTKMDISAYTNRITNASPTELVVIMYEIAEEYILSATICKRQENYEGFKYNLQKGKQFINELNSVLDMKYKISYDLMSLYMFMNRTLVNAIITGEDKNIPAVLSMLKKLREAFKEISNQDTRGPVMKNVQTVYAGLTYSKGSLNETFETQHNRGYTV